MKLSDKLRIFGRFLYGIIIVVCVIKIIMTLINSEISELNSSISIAYVIGGVIGIAIGYSTVLLWDYLAETLDYRERQCNEIKFLTRTINTENIDNYTEDEEYYD